MKLTLVLLASLLFLATVVRAEEEEPTSIEQVKDELPQEDDNDTELAEKVDAEDVLREMTDNEDDIPQLDKKSVSQS